MGCTGQMVAGDPNSNIVSGIYIIYILFYQNIEILSTKSTDPSFTAGTAPGGSEQLRDQPNPFGRLHYHNQPFGTRVQEGHDPSAVNPAQERHCAPRRPFGWLSKRGAWAGDVVNRSLGCKSLDLVQKEEQDPSQASLLKEPRYHDQPSPLSFGAWVHDPSAVTPAQERHCAPRRPFGWLSKQGAWAGDVVNRSLGCKSLDLVQKEEQDPSQASLLKEPRYHDQPSPLPFGAWVHDHPSPVSPAQEPHNCILRRVFRAWAGVEVHVRACS
jgi:hypothetical protein